MQMISPLLDDLTFGSQASDGSYGINKYGRNLGRVYRQHGRRYAWAYFHAVARCERGGHRSFVHAANNLVIEDQDCLDERTRCAGIAAAEVVHSLHSLKT